MSIQDVEDLDTPSIEKASSALKDNIKSEMTGMNPGWLQQQLDHEARELRKWSVEQAIKTYAEQANVRWSHVKARSTEITKFVDSGSW